MSGSNSCNKRHVLKQCENHFVTLLIFSKKTKTLNELNMLWKFGSPLMPTCSFGFFAQQILCYVHFLLVF